jgi:ribosomal protein S19
MSRSNWKGPVFNKNLFSLILSQENFLNWNKKIKKRNCTLPFVSTEDKVNIYNGNVFKRVTITKERTGFKFGLFSDSRKHRIKKDYKKK